MCIRDSHYSSDRPCNDPVKEINPVKRKVTPKIIVLNMLIHRNPITILKMWVEKLKVKDTHSTEGVKKTTTALIII